MLNREIRRLESDRKELAALIGFDLTKPRNPEFSRLWRKLVETRPQARRWADRMTKENLPYADALGAILIASPITEQILNDQISMARKALREAVGGLQRMEVAKKRDGRIEKAA